MESVEDEDGPRTFLGNASLSRTIPMKFLSRTLNHPVEGTACPGSKWSTLLRGKPRLKIKTGSGRFKQSVSRQRGKTIGKRSQFKQEQCEFERGSSEFQTDSVGVTWYTTARQAS